MKTSKLQGAALDWAVAKCEGFRVELNHQYTEDKKFDGWWQCGPYHWQPLCKYSTDWSQGGPIIEREEIDIYCHESPKSGCGWWVAEITGTKAKARGNTPLVAAMRCYVASKLGDEVEIPEELCS